MESLSGITQLGICLVKFNPLGTRPEIQTPDIGNPGEQHRCSNWWWNGVFFRVPIALSIINIVIVINIGDRRRANMKHVALEGVENDETIRNYLLSAKPPRGTKHQGTGDSSCSAVYP